MTNQEAIDILYWSDLELAKIIEARTVVMAALNKQTSIKPIVTTNPVTVFEDNIDFTCPKCNKVIISINYDPIDNDSIDNKVKLAHKPNYCEDCGQKIDWS